MNQGTEGGRCQIELTFSCRMCLSSLSSLYVRLLKTGVLKGFMIFLIATEAPVSWSFAELPEASISCVGRRIKQRTTRDRMHLF
jgi:hypothetical protein